jgi:hypothetical protein
MVHLGRRQLAIIESCIGFAQKLTFQEGRVGSKLFSHEFARMNTNKSQEVTGQEIFGQKCRQP